MRVLFLRSRLVVEGEEGQVEEVEEVEEVGVREEVSLRGTGVGGMIAFFGAFFSFAVGDQQTYNDSQPQLNE